MKILLDLDGVLCDFVGSACHFYGEQNPYRYGWPHVCADISEILEKPNIWDELGYEFWTTVDKYQWSDSLIKLCESFGSVYICSSPSVNPQSAAGKLTWIKHNYPGYEKRYVLTHFKSLLANPNTILIDDWRKHTSAFKARGGKAILFPQPWNKIQVLDRMKFVEDQLRVLR